MGPPYSLRIPRVHKYSGYGWSLQNFVYRTITVFGQASQPVRLSLHVPCSVHTPVVFLPPVWPLPISLATTFGISFDFSSSAYLDVSVQQVPSSMPILFSIGYMDFTPCGFPHSEIRGSKAICALPRLIAACHVLLRLPVPRHPPCALSCLTFVFMLFAI